MQNVVKRTFLFVLAILFASSVAQANFLMRLSGTLDPFAPFFKPRSGTDGLNNAYILPEKRGLMDIIRPVGQGPLILPISNGAQVEFDFDNQTIHSISDYTLDSNLGLQALHKSVIIERGDSIARALKRASIEATDASEAMNALASVFDLREVQAGWKINLIYEPKQNRLASAALQSSADTRYVIEREGEAFVAQKIAIELVKHHVATKIIITDSLYNDAALAYVPDTIIANSEGYLSHAINFKRDIKNGNTLEMVYEEYRNKSGLLVKTGNILFIGAQTDKAQFDLYRFKKPNGAVGYYTAKGKNPRSQQSISRKPVKEGRMSSVYGMRKHPTTGKYRMHNGVDYAAPTGTPIYAAADGKITYRARKGSYGNLIEIKHASGYTTRYAHMSKFKSGYRVGSTVRKGSVIGYVGTTGRSTGPHLHYELLKNGKHINPLKAKLPTGQFLESGEKKLFEQTIRVVNELRKKAVLPTKDRVDDL